MEILHKIRLEIKRIKAILKLIRFTQQNFRMHNTYKPLRTIFRKAGLIRESLVFQNLLSHYAPNNTIDELLLLPTPKTISGFRKNIPHYLTSVKKIGKVIDRACKKVKTIEVLHCIQKLKNTVRKRLHPAPNLSALHAARKSCKAIVYLSATLKNRKNILPPFFAEMAMLIGSWHDKKYVIHILSARGIPQEEIIHKIELACENDLVHIQELATHYYGLRVRQGLGEAKAV
ncbi:MAG: CHAD domain-containing protein [Cyclobacteriaceae bacterium]|nr:CHAD domain-containing protein [Cyclobacteriaceae bacterium]